MLHLLVITKRRYLGRNLTLYYPELYYKRGLGPDCDRKVETSSVRNRSRQRIHQQLFGADAETQNVPVTKDLPPGSK